MLVHLQLYYWAVLNSNIIQPKITRTKMFNQAQHIMSFLVTFYWHDGYMYIWIGFNVNFLSDHNFIVAYCTFNNLQ